MLGPWPRGLDMLIYTIDDDWHAKFTAGMFLFAVATADC
jgi:hypothetical protein